MRATRTSKSLEVFPLKPNFHRPEYFQWYPRGLPRPGCGIVDGTVLGILQKETRNITILPDPANLTWNSFCNFPNLGTGGFHPNPSGCRQCSDRGGLFFSERVLTVFFGFLVFDDCTLRNFNPSCIKLKSIVSSQTNRRKLCVQCDGAVRRFQ